MAQSDRDLLLATRPFTVEDRPRSIVSVVSTFAALAAAGLGAAALTAWPLRVAFALAEALLVVRAFCLFHDVQHGALLRGSAAAKAFFWGFGQLILVPPSVWRETHNYHHAHTAQLVGSHIGSYPVLTPRLYAALPRWKRWLYRAARHPLNIALAGVTVFLLGMCLKPFVRAPAKHPTAVVSPLLVGALAAAAFASGRGDVFLFAWALPMSVAFAMGAYLFYAQHNFPQAQIATREEWSFSGAALHSSSYMPMGRVMQWCTANIGYHHVHHLNPAIPFYRLPEAMAAVGALQHPGVTTLAPRDVAACFRLKLWDPEQRHFTPFTPANER
ncbi:MAG: fatty acid desaturase [Archangiaceae bacterium]|nr:fatty acid desaturase [Archangiaceae bacterium]